MTQITGTAATRNGDTKRRTDAYVNVVYPASNRLYSRPYNPWHFNYEETPSLNWFFFGFLNIGKNMLGMPYDFNFDIDEAILRNNGRICAASPWDAATVYEFSQTPAYKIFTQSLPSHVASAFDTIAEECHPDKNFRHGGINDLPKLVDAFKTIWAHNWMLDARLALAEEMFAYTSLGPVISCGHHHAESKTSLEWLTDPINADRVAHAFLYSRLAQHFGETDPRSVDLAARTHAKLKAGKTEDALIHEVKAEAGLSGFFITAVGPGFSTLFGIKRPENPRGLWKSLPSMYVDHARLLDGSWARSQLEQIVLPAMSQQKMPRLEIVPK